MVTLSRRAFGAGSFAAAAAVASSPPKRQSMGDRLRAARLSNRLTVAACADYVCVTPDVWQSWESDQAIPDAEEVCYAGRLLGVTAPWLTFGETA